MRRLFAPTCIVTAALAFTVLMSAQELQQKQAQTHYTVTDLGTLGGTFSLAGGMNNRGAVIGASTLPGDTVLHGFLWQKGVMTDLGTLGGQNSDATWPLSDSNLIGGSAETPTLDPNGENFCGFDPYTGLACVPFLWQKGVMTELPTLGGTNGQAYEVNSWGVVVGNAENEKVDRTCPPPQILRWKPVFWYKGSVHELPTLRGDTVGTATVVNDLGLMAGVSLTCADYGAGSANPVLWRDGKVAKIGTLGGTFGFPLEINNWGLVVGESNLSGDTATHAFLWQKRTGMIDLGTLGTDVSSYGEGINNLGQIVGASCDSDGNCRAVLWQHGVMTDLNTLIPADSSLYLSEASGTINDRGQIAGYGYDAVSGEFHAFLLNPCDGITNCAEQDRALANSVPRQRPQLPANMRKLLPQRNQRGHLHFRPAIPMPK